MRYSVSILVSVLSLLASAAASALEVAPAEMVAAGGVDLVVGGYSIPTLADWNGDDLPDLVVGEGGGAVSTGKVRVYLNQGSPGEPEFAGFSYAQAAGIDLAWPASGCQGLYPRVVQWDGDGNRDLLVGLADGRVRLYRNVAADDDPAFDAGSFVTRGGVDLDVGSRATPIVTDWDGDGRQDLVVGAMDGRVRVYLNAGTQGAPVFVTETVVAAGGSDLLVPSGRSSLCLADLDDDGVRDLLTGNTDGQLLIYHNDGTEHAPIFNSFAGVTADGVAIDLDGTPRSRPCLVDWDDDLALDILVGSGDGKVRLYRGLTSVPVPETMTATRLPQVVVAPNPFNPRTTVTVELTRPGQAVLSILALDGRRFLCRPAGWLAAGRHDLVWDGRDDAGRSLPSGTYLVRVDAGGVSGTTRATLVR
jgi:hypothetical protein